MPVTLWLLNLIKLNQTNNNNNNKTQNLIYLLISPMSLYYESDR